MSWVALAKAIIQKKKSEPWSHHEAGIVNATPPRAAPMSSCMVTIHQRFDFSMSTNGLHRGLMTQGRYSQEV